MYKPTVTSPFGLRIHPIEKIEKMHYGADYVSATNRIYNITPYNLVFKDLSYSNTGGYALTLQSHSHEFTLRHLPSTIKNNFKAVYRPGEFISMAGRTGQATGVHLHLEVRPLNKSNAPQDPIDPQVFFKNPNNVHWAYKYLPEKADTILDTFNFDEPVTRGELYALQYKINKEV